VWLKLARKNLDTIDTSVAGAQLSLKHAGLALGDLVHNLGIELGDGHEVADIQGELDNAARSLRHVARIVRLRQLLLEGEEHTDG